MNPKHFGDSFDIVKRFICLELKQLRFNVVIDPMFTGEWQGKEKQFYKLIGVTPISARYKMLKNSALFLDPDTGIHKKGSIRHATFDRIISELKRFTLVVSFDQSFTRGNNTNPAILAKLDILKQQNCHCFYYNTQAKFLFASRNSKLIKRLQNHFINIGIPKERYI